MAIDWTKPIRFVVTGNPAEYVGITDALGVYAVRHPMTGTIVLYYSDGKAHRFNGNYKDIENVPEPKRRGELFVDVIEEKPGAPLLYRFNGGEVRSNMGRVLAVVKLQGSEWEEGDFRADQAKAQETR